MPARKRRTKTMKLISLKLGNFKGQPGFALETAGGNVSIFGDNATGKSLYTHAFETYYRYQAHPVCYYCYLLLTHS